MGWLAAAPWIASAVGSIFGGKLSQKGQQEANLTNVLLSREQMDFQKESNQKQMDFEERMSGTAHQRAVRDLEAAGLNPMLAYSGGASSPGGASSAGSMARVENPNEAFGHAVSGGVSSAMAARAAHANLEILRTTDNKLKQEAYNARLNGMLLEKAMPYTIANSKAIAEGTEISNVLAKAEIPGANLGAEIDSSPLGRVLRYIERISGAGSSAIGAISPLRGLLSPGGGVRRRR